MMWYHKYKWWIYLLLLLFVINIVSSYLVSDKLVYERIPLLYLIVIFFGGLLIMGGLKGLKATLTLILTVYVIIKILLPLILAGYDPILVSVSICAVLIMITLLVIGGYNKKTLAAIIGTTGGVIIAGLLAYVTGSMAHLNGLGSEETIHLILYSKQIDFKGLLFAGIIIGAMGAVMDVGMSIASAMYEIQSANPQIDKNDLVAAGMNVGRDIMGTMSNTLILAYVGSSLNLLLLFLTYDMPMNEIIGRDNFAAEIVRALAGSIGLIFSIPLTAISAGILSKSK